MQNVNLYKNMRTIQTILFITCCFMFGFCNNNYAQNSNEQAKRFIEQTINGQTYVYDTLRCIIQNKNNHIDSIVESHHCDYGVEMIKNYDVIFDKVFSAERKKELNGKVLPLFFYCDSTGTILEVGFRVRALKITLQELNTLENAF